jgi:hypothetical protein
MEATRGHSMSDVPGKYPDRIGFWHKNWGTPESCDLCHGRGLHYACVEKHDHGDGSECDIGWYAEVYCECPLGRDRLEAEKQ